MSLRLFLDTADPGAWQEWLPSGLFHGVTCNPTLLRRARQPCSLANLAALTQRALDLGAAEIHLQAWGATAPAYTACGEALAALAPGQVVVKLPISRDGARAARQLIGSGTPVTLTAGYEPHQALLAAALDANYLAPYLGRLLDLGRDGHADLIQMQRCLEGLGSPLRLLVASLRQPSDLTTLAAAGLDSFTISPCLAAALFQVEATLAAAEQFEQDALANAG
ncbi:MAG: transaldolase family protein [Cyanobium sp.]|jgi:transaldolase|nr:transaldolase family protein [Synechococcaceae cyanobacterium]